MCLPGSPAFTHSPGAPPPPPPPQYLHNPYLDGATFGQGSNKGRNSLVTMGVSNGLGTSGSSGLPTAPAPRNGRPTPVPTSAGNPALTTPAAPQSPGVQVPMVLGQPGSVVPTVGGVMAGSVAGRVTSPTTPTAAQLSASRGR